MLEGTSVDLWVSLMAALKVVDWVVKKVAL
jgi:hypothetical protein